MDAELVLFGLGLVVVFLVLLWEAATPTWDKDLERDDRMIDLTGRRW